MVLRHVVVGLAVAAVSCGGVHHRVEIVDHGYIPQFVAGTLPARAWLDDDGEVRLHIDLAHACAEKGVALQRDTYSWRDHQAGQLARNEVETADTVIDSPGDDRTGVACIPDMVKDIASLQVRTPWGATIAGTLDGSGEAIFPVDWRHAHSPERSWWFELPGARRVIAQWAPSQVDRELAQDWVHAREPAPLVEPLAASVVHDDLVVEVKNRGRVAAHIVPLDVSVGRAVVQVWVENLPAGQTTTVRAPVPHIDAPLDLATVAQPQRPPFAVLLVPCGAQFSSADTVRAHDTLDQLAFRGRVDAEAADRARYWLDHCMQ
jgi:hypothetical protein